MVATGAEPHLLRRTLRSAREQQTPLLEILVVCLDAGARRTALQVAGDDTRVRILDAPTVRAGHRLGGRRRRGARVVLAAAGDLYLPGAIDAALEIDAGHGRSVLLARRDDPPGPGDLEVAPAVAAVPRLGRFVLSDVDEDLFVDDGDPDGVATAARLLRRGFVVTDRPAYDDVRGSAPPPFSVRVDPLPRLGARIARDRSALGSLDSFDEARGHFAAGALDALQRLLEVAEVANAPAWTALSAHAAMLWEVAGRHVEALDVVPRAMARLAATGRRADLVDLVASRRFAGTEFPTTVVDGEVYADLGVEVEPACLRVATHESGVLARARRLLAADDALLVELAVAVAHVEPSGVPDVQAQLRAGDRIVPLATTVQPGRDEALVACSCPLDLVADGSWAIELTWQADGLVRRGQVTRIDPHGSASRLGRALSGREVRLRDTLAGVRLHVGPATSDPPVGDVRAIEVGALSLHVTVGGDADEVWLDGPVGHVHATPQHGGVWALPLAHDVWGLGERPLPSGDYRLHVARDGARRPVRLPSALLDRLPEVTRTAGHRLSLLRGDGDGLVVRLEPPLADDETGPRAQRVLQARYASVDDGLDDRLVYFQSFTGQWANDHPLAIQQELVRRRPDLRVRWAVADSSAAAPEGSEPVLFRSREWYDVLARAGHIVTNIELERWFRRRTGQQILQTFHGYPSKTMGLGLWRSRGLLPSHLEQQLDHTSRTWNALLTPDPEMDQYYRREYDYDGRILALGYPRDDVLVGPDRQAIRTDTRHRLGIAPGQRAVLYAPTWRDDLATNFRAAEAVDHLDVEQAASALGGDHVLLLRGHRFHASAGSSRPAGARVVDVTTYPDVNHLILAADVAVLDYSSMRFDFALTGRPMVFLVPDLDDYESRTRGFLWDFGETAPGPRVRDTAGVVAELRDLEALATRWRGPLDAFNDRYNRLQDGHAAERVVADFFADLPVSD